MAMPSTQSLTSPATGGATVPPVSSPPAPVNVQRLLDEQPLSPYQWLVFGLCFFIVLLDGFDTAAIGYIAPSLMQEWGVAKPALAPVLSAALFGLAAGALSAGPLADRWGRKRVLTGSVLLFGLACLASASADNLTALTAWRFVTGIGLGAAMPNAVTLMSEYSPSARRATLTNAMFCGFPLGAASGGFLAAWLIPQYGWRSVLVLGGVAPLVLVLLLWRGLPESVRYMVAHGHAPERIRGVLLRMTAAASALRQQVQAAPGFVLHDAQAAVAAHAGATTATTTPTGPKGLALVLSAGYRTGSAMLWLAYFMGLVIFYALINWMPLLFKDAGLDPKTATLIAALFPLGGVGAVVAGWLMDRFHATRVVAAGYALTALSLWAVGQSVGHLGWLVAAVFVAGTLMNTAQASMPALAAAWYPTQGRATGVAWMLGIGRFGGIAGSFLVAQLAAWQLGFADIFTVIAVPGLLAAAALMFKAWTQRAPLAAPAATPPHPLHRSASP